ncbi:MAG: SMI1/KNR4 family protein [Corynebacterium sp.]|uniref:SMI1/KNR4 family protein n=1 Tax=Corynebacterium sp. TaxID=1720 RepID=UPI0026DC9BA2|nr:SMI1/KNR4 family protein [Corynebacterium sp.]MDO5097772.1 SMI1/KNR4 family protein [Corynebacterium sp.]
MNDLATFNFEGFWRESDWSKNFQCEPLTDSMIAEVEAELGYKLPQSYIQLAHNRNGGVPVNDCYPTDSPTAWAKDHVAVDGIFGIGASALYSLLGPAGSKYWQDECGYPDWGVYFAATPTAGPEMFLLDYRECGPDGEPRVVYIDQEKDYAWQVIAPDFATFISGFANQDLFDDARETIKDAFNSVSNGSFSPIIDRAFTKVPEARAHIETLLRTVGNRIVEDKGYFGLHDDTNSHQIYDAMFWLLSQLKTPQSIEDFLLRAPDQSDYSNPCYELMLPLCFSHEPFGFTTDGWNSNYLHCWWDSRLSSGYIVKTDEGFQCSESFYTDLLRLEPIDG